MHKSESLFANSELSRYSRHLTLPQVGISGQKKLKSSSILAIGCGGLGSPLLSYLAAVGIGRLGIIDFDVVDESNLQRQIIHGCAWIDKYKTESAKHRIEEINPYCIVECYKTKVSIDNALDIINKYDIVCDGSDNFPTRYLVNDACYILKKPYVYGSVLRFEGQASVFNLNEDSPNYRDLVPEPPPPGLVPSCAEGGVIGVLPGIIGTIQATEAIKIILGIGQILDGRLLLFNALDMKFKELHLKKDYSLPTINKLVNYDDSCNLNKYEIDQSIDVMEFSKIYQMSDKQFILIDVRTIEEREICYIDNSIHIPLADLESDSKILDQLEEQSRNRHIYIYCKMGSRSRRAVELLNSLNINATNINGGIIDWIKKVDKTLCLY